MDTSNLGANAGQYFEMGQRAGGRLSGVGSALKVLVDTLNQDKALKQEMSMAKEKIGLEGAEQERLYGIKAKIDEENKSELEKVIEKGQVADSISKIGAINGDVSPYRDIFSPKQTSALGSPLIVKAEPSDEAQYIPQSYDLTPFGEKKYKDFKRIPTEEEKEQARYDKSTEQGALAAEKLARLSEAKLNRFIPLRKEIEKNWKSTIPYRATDGSPTSGIVKTFGMPLPGLWDISKKWLQVTDAQRKDKAYTDFIGGLRGRLARTLGEDVGNLSEYEQRAVLATVPTLFDTLETGLLKLGSLDSLIEEIKLERQNSKKGISLKRKVQETEPEETSDENMKINQMLDQLGAE